MQNKLTLSAIEAIVAGIVPDIAPASPEAPKINIVDVRLRAVLEHKYELVFRAVKGAQPCVRLVPKANIFQLRIDGLCCTQQLFEVTPIHANKMDGAVDRMLPDETK